MRQRTLPLLGGEHPGPLFVPVKTRAAKPSVRGAARYRFLRSRTPPWADKNCLRALRKLLQIYSQALGVQYSEDHIVPLRHPLVSGLHCPDNIEIVLLDDNVRRGNSFGAEQGVLF